MARALYCGGDQAEGPRRTVPGVRSVWDVASTLALRSMRFSLIDLPDFFDIECRGDLSAMSGSLIGNLSGSVSGGYAA